MPEDRTEIGHTTHDQPEKAKIPDLFAKVQYWQDTHENHNHKIETPHSSGVFYLSCISDKANDLS